MRSQYLAPPRPKKVVRNELALQTITSYLHVPLTDAIYMHTYIDRIEPAASGASGIDYVILGLLCRTTDDGICTLGW